MALVFSQHLGETCSDHGRWAPFALFCLCVYMYLSQLPVFIALVGVSPPPGYEVSLPKA